MGSAAEAVVGEGRFRLEERVGAGAYAEVFRARDERSGGVVAVKLLRSHDERALARFEREARLLSSIDSDNVVDYVAHGFEDERPWIALEWLEGMDLDRFRRSHVPSLPEAVDLARQAALGLGTLHRAGIVHRDVKPANFFRVVRDGRPNVKLIDLGIAKSDLDAQLTAVGSQLGTPLYMSPEQAGGKEVSGPASDVFSLGVMLYELFTGESPFSAEHSVAVMVRVLLHQPPALRARVPAAPESLERLVARSMEKDPARRFASAMELAEALGAVEIAEATGGAAPTREQRPRAREQRVVTAVFVALPAGGGGGPAEQVDELAAEHGGDGYRLLGGRSVVLFGAVRSSGDESVRAGRFALAVRTALPSARISIATGRAMSGTGSVAGQVIDRGTALLAQADAGEVRLDPLSERLLGSRFAVEGDSSRRRLRSRLPPAAGELASVAARRVPFLEREREMETLTSLVRRSLQGSDVAAALVLGPDGIGKTRLRMELLQALGAGPGAPRTLVVQGDPLLVDVPLGMLSRGLRTLVEQSLGTRDPSREALDAFCASLSLPRIALGRLLGIHDDPPTVPAAGGDPAALAERLRRAAVALLAALASPAGLLLVIEDLQWADPSSLGAIAAARDAIGHGQGFALLALGRPEAGERFAAAWSERAAERIDLAPLSADATRTIARAMLGERGDAALLRSVVERADGNPLFAGELVHAAMHGEGGELPAAIQGALQVRLDALPALAKEIAVTASVLGSAAWREAIVAMRGGQGIDLALAFLSERGLLDEQGSSRFPGTRELSFRHALVRDAAYAMLPADERRALHGAAAAWLASAGESDPVVLAHHLEQAGRAEEAAERYLAAAHHAFGQAAYRAALSHAERGLALATAGRTVVELRLVAADACHRLGSYARALSHAQAGVDLGGDAVQRTELAAVQVLVLRRTGRRDEARQRAAEALPLATDRPSSGLDALALAHARLRIESAWTELDADEAAAAAGIARDVLDDLPDDRDDLAALALAAGHVFGRALHALGDLQGAAATLRGVVDRALALGHLWRGLGARHDLALAQISLGRGAEAMVELTACRDEARTVGLPSAEGYALLYLGLGHLHAGAEVEAVAALGDALVLADRIGASPLLGAAEALLGVAELFRGRADRASEHAREASSLPGVPEAWRLVAAAVAALTGGDPTGAERLVDALPGVRGHPEAYDVLALLCRDLVGRSGDPALAARLSRHLDEELKRRSAMITDGPSRERLRSSLPWR